MAVSIEELWKMADVELMSAYYDAKRLYVERKFARDTQRARLEWLRAKAFIASSGGVTERKTAVDASDELGRKGQELRELSRDLELIKADVDVMALIVRMRGGSLQSEAKAEDLSEGESAPLWSS